MCELCKKHYHMECVNPPLLSKPSRGYGWSCASCNNKRENKELEVNTSKNRQSRDLVTAAVKARAKARSTTKIEEQPDKYWKGWSFRYFGYASRVTECSQLMLRRQHTVAEDTLGKSHSCRFDMCLMNLADPDDMIYVRAPTRIGRAFQTIVADIPVGASGKYNSTLLISRLTGHAEDPDIPVRGGDETIELLGNVVHMTPDQGMFPTSITFTVINTRCSFRGQVLFLHVVEADGESRAVERRKGILTARKDLQHNVDWIEEVIRRFSEAWLNKQSFYSVNMRKPLCVRAVSVLHAAHFFDLTGRSSRMGKSRDTVTETGARLKRPCSTSR